MLYHCCLQYLGNKIQYILSGCKDNYFKESYDYVGKLPYLFLLEVGYDDI